jgi:hypothetical protein
MGASTMSTVQRLTKLRQPLMKSCVICRSHGFGIGHCGLRFTIPPLLKINKGEHIQDVRLQRTPLRECETSPPFGFVQFSLLREIEHREIVVGPGILRSGLKSQVVRRFRLRERPSVEREIPKSDHCRHVRRLLSQGLIVLCSRTAKSERPSHS